MDLTTQFGTATPVIGMVHLPPLPGAPEYKSDRRRLRGEAFADALELVENGCDGLLVENYGDRPYYPESVPTHVVAELTATVRELGIGVTCPYGVNVLRNDATAALSVAAAAGGSFIRVNVHTGVRETDQGWLEGRAHETLRLRERLGADVAVFADVAVKHSRGPTAREIEPIVSETIERGLADGVIVSGPATGKAADADELQRVVAVRDEIDPELPVFVGSGVTVENASSLLEYADGVIVGTALKVDGVTTNSVDPERVAALVDAVNES